jgi:hypothetical protein
MESGDCLQHLKSSILSIFPIDHISLNELLDIFTFTTLSSDEFLSKAGDYSSSFGFICKGIMLSYYNGHTNEKVVKNVFADHMFVIPLPSFIYRKPSYLNYKAVSEVVLLQAKFSKLEELSLKHAGIYKFSRTLIDREWIVNREIHESTFHIYNNHTRFELFMDKFGKYITLIEPAIISSFLQIPLKQVEKFIVNQPPLTI